MKRTDQPPIPAMSPADVAAHAAASHVRRPAASTSPKPPAHRPRPSSSGAIRTATRVLGTARAATGRINSVWLQKTTELAYIQRKLQLADAVRRDLAAGGVL